MFFSTQIIKKLLISFIYREDSEPNDTKSRSAYEPAPLYAPPAPAAYAKPALPVTYTYPSPAPKVVSNFHKNIIPIHSRIQKK